MHKDNLVYKKKQNQTNIESTKLFSIEKKNIKTPKLKNSNFEKVDYSLFFTDIHKIFFSKEEKEIIKFHLLTDFKEEYRKEVKYFNNNAYIIY